MPIDTIPLGTEIPHVSILDAEGNFDEALAPVIAEDELREIFEHMITARRFDERRLQLQRQGSIGTFAPVKGQEAANLGPISALEERDWFVPSFREPAAAVYRGASMEQILIYDAGFNEGAAVPEGGHDLPVCVPVASQLPHAVGIAYASRLRDDEEVVMTFFGDGATSEGDFHEAMNFASTWKCPVVFVCQNNQWAISVPRHEQTASKTLAQKAIAYGMEGVQVDGNDLFACRYAADRAVTRAREGEGPTMIECVTYRLSLHTTADDPSRYRDDAEVEAWEKKDPLVRLRRFLTERKILDDADIEKMEQRADERIADAWKAAKSRIAELERKPQGMFDHLFAEMPRSLLLQRKAFERDHRRAPPERDESSTTEGEEAGREGEVAHG